MGSDRGAAVSQRISSLAVEMRRSGARVGPAEVLTAHRALAVVDPSSREQARHALRAAMSSSPEDFERFDRAFEQVFGGTEEGSAAVRQQPRGGDGIGPESGDGRQPGEGAEDDKERIGDWSAARALREKDFAKLDEGERQAVMAAILRLSRIDPTRRSPRSRPSRGRGERIDVRRTARRELRADLEPPRLDWTARSRRPRRLVLACDASRSMTAYSEPVLRFAQAAIAANRRIEVFVFSTDLTRVTAELTGKDFDAALARAIGAVDDWDSGTRIGASLSRLTHDYSGRLGRGATVVIVSDGWDRGDPDQLRAEMERLRRCSHSIVWVNPHAAAADFEPLTRGMVAALGSIDHLVAGASLVGLENLIEVIEAVA